MNITDLEGRVGCRRILFIITSTSLAAIYFYHFLGHRANIFLVKCVIRHALKKNVVEFYNQDPLINRQQRRDNREAKLNLWYMDAVWSKVTFQLVMEALWHFFFILYMALVSANQQK